LCIIFSALDEKEYKLTEKEEFVHPSLVLRPSKKIKWASIKMIFPSEISG